METSVPPVVREREHIEDAETGGATIYIIGVSTNTYFTAVCLLMYSV